MKTHLKLIAAIAAAAALSACGDRTQTIGSSGVGVDGAAFQGTGKSFAAPGWKPGDKTSWEQQLKTRTQNGQNDYTKVN